MGTDPNSSSNRSAGGYSQAKIDQVWQKATPLEGHDPKERRVDQYGTEIVRSAYGDVNSRFGWDIDHKTPVSKGGSSDISNLQPLHIQNNRLKADS